MLDELGIVAGVRPQGMVQVGDEELQFPGRPECCEGVEQGDGVGAAGDGDHDARAGVQQAVRGEGPVHGGLKVVHSTCHRVIPQIVDRLRR